jgi:hypothetical protein
MRWFRFSLRTLLLAVTLVAMVLSWFVWQNSLVQRRNDFLEMLVAQKGEYAFLIETPSAGRLDLIWTKQYPGGQYMMFQMLNRLDEKILAYRSGRYRAWLNDRTIGAIKMPSGSAAADRETAASLFPEATIE